eukprot:3013043-Pleurochrysis_carterae.AAC.1
MAYHANGERGEAIREGGEVRKEHNLERHVNLKTDSVHKIAEHALVRPAGQGGSYVRHVQGRGRFGSEVAGHDDRPSQ